MNENLNNLNVKLAALETELLEANAATKLLFKALLDAERNLKASPCGKYTKTTKALQALVNGANIKWQENYNLVVSVRERISKLRAEVEEAKRVASLTPEQLEKEQKLVQECIERAQKKAAAAALAAERAKLYTIECTGNAVVGDRVKFEQSIFTGSYKNATFSHYYVVEGEIIKDSYGGGKQQHTFTILLLDGTKMLIKGRNVYRNGTFRMRWANEKARELALDEKYKRGGKAREARTARREIQQNEGLQKQSKLAL